jgi:outer membrane protein assembly factor BamB
MTVTLRCGLFGLAVWLFAACYADSEIESKAQGKVGFALELPSSLEIEAISYELAGPGAFSKTGTFELPASSRSFSETVEGVPAGSGYVLHLTAASADGRECKAAASFDVTSGTATKLVLNLRCPGRGPSDEPGSVVVEGTVNVCPVAAPIVATPSDDGRTVLLSGRGSDEDDAPGPLEYSWTTARGTLATASGSEVELECPRSGGAAEVTLEVSDTDCVTQTSVTVACAADASLSQAVAYQIGPRHDGYQPHDTLHLPLAARWTHDFGASRISYPIVAMGRVFVTVANDTDYGTTLTALDAATGTTHWGPLEIPGTYFWSNASYEDGRLFVLNTDGLLRAFDAESGNQLWVAQMPDQYSFSSPPTAFGGRVYVGGAGSGGTLYAVDAASGVVDWRTGVSNGDNSAPAVSELGIFVSYACNQAYRFAFDGSLLWHASGDCSGGGGKTVALSDQRAYTRDSDANWAFDALTGTLLGTYSSRTIPAIAEGVLYTLEDGILSAVPEGSSTPRWSFGDGNLTSAPLVVGEHVVVGSSSGELTVLSRADGSQVSSYELEQGIPFPDEQNVSSPLTGFAAAENKLFVPAGTTLTAF